MSKKSEAGAFRTSIGGQALLEGIMMRGPEKTAMVVRTADGLVTKEEKTTFIKDKYPILGWPLIRGTVNFVTSLITGMNALMFSVSCMPEEEQAAEETKFDKLLDKKVGSEKADKLVMTLSMVLGIALAVGLFILLPTFIVGLFSKALGTGLWRNLAEGAVRIILFLAYMRLVTLLKDIKRMWMYHGAEHKTIFCYENGLELTVENCRRQPRQHPRCGTSFIFLVMIVSILVFSFVRWDNALVRAVMRIVLLPVVVGISYEIIKYSGRHDNWLTKILSAPGKALQNLTTAEPDDSMLEVAIAALKLVIPQEKGTDEW